MPDRYPYTISNNKIEPILTRIRSAARPERFSQELLKTWGFTASNDRAMVRVMRDLGFVGPTGTPTEHYDRLRHPNDWPYVLAERIQDLYRDLYAIDSNMHRAPESEIRGAMSRVTGKDDETVQRYYNTFKALASLANFNPKAGGSERPKPPPKHEREEAKPEPSPIRRQTEYHYNIQIHLPVTTDITVYNAIFKSLKDNLGI